MCVWRQRLVRGGWFVAWCMGIVTMSAQTPTSPAPQRPAPTRPAPQRTAPSTRAVAAKPVGTLSAAEADAAKYVYDSTKPRVPYRLNLGDDRQYAYVLAMLRLAGDSPAKSPQLYKSLAATHAGDKAGPPELAMGEKQSQDTNTTLITPLNLIQYVYDNDIIATSSLLSSVPGGTDNTTMMVNYRIQGQSVPFAVSPIYKQSAGGKQFTQKFTAPLPSGQQNGIVVASSLMLTTKNNRTGTYSMTLDDASPNATSVCSTAPNYGVQQQPPLACPPVGAPCINQQSITKNIVNCYGRNGGDCNYSWGGSGYPPSMTISVAGSMTFPYPVNPSLQGSYVMNLQRSDGGCFLPPGGGEPAALTAANFSISGTDPKTLNFCFQGSALPNSGCLSAVSSNVFLGFTVYALLNTDNPSNYGMGMISSDATQSPHQPWFAQVPIITVFQGCFAPGTEITLADGTTRKVEAFKGDGSETILLNATGTTAKVVGTGDGVEAKPLLRITDNAGHAVVVTETHAIVTGRGPKMAWQVRVGDTLRTRQGVSKVAKIDALPVVANQKVHNLFIGDMKQAEAGKTTMFANGILVGDMYMQTAVYHRAQQQGFTTAEVLSRLPKEWHRDYLNSVANHTNRK
jgi:hypothetical protein